MEKRPFSIILIIFSLAVFCSYHIYYYVINGTNKNLVKNYDVKEIKKENIVQKVSNDKEEYLAILEIPKINIKQGFYNINSNNNNVNKNITLLKGSIMPNREGSIIYLAAHSGTGYLAYFKDLNKLSIGDIVNIKYQNKNYYYSINDIYEAPKNGTITINHNIHENYLVLTTCSKNKSQQLVITSKLTNKI